MGNCKEMLLPLESCFNSRYWQPGGYTGRKGAEGSERGARGCSGGIGGMGGRGGVGRPQQEGIKCPLFFSTTVTALPHYGECGGSMWIYL